MTSSRGVWVAFLRDSTSGSQELPDQVQITTIATIVARVAGNNVLWGQFNIAVVLGSNAESVGHGSSAGHCPAGTAVSLISDWTNAVTESLSTVELGRDVGLDNRVVSLNVQSFLDWHKVTKSLLHLFHGHTFELLVGP